MPGTAPYSIAVLVNGSGAGNLSLETLSSRDGALMSYRGALVPASRVYAPQPALGVAVLELTRGVADIEVLAEDKNGAQARAIYRLQVN
jgi:hypothetical protein